MECAATYMCEEIVIEILTRLPAKSLIRFTAVCRLWKSTITSPQFRLVSNRPTKLLAHTARECYALDEQENRLMFQTYFPPKLFSSYKDTAPVVIGSDNGLLCISIPNPNRVVLWNPCIRKHLIIPDHHNPHVDDDNSSSTMTEYPCGFGGTTNNDYKYVRVEEKAVNIYSLKSGTWRTKYLDWDITQDEIKTETCALVRGRLHWICGLKKEILPFELEDEVFEDKITMPHVSIGNKNNLKVAIIRESLAVVTSEIGDVLNPGTAVCVWVMDKYGDINSWNKLFNIVVVNDFCRVERNMVHLLKDDELLLGLRRIVYPLKLKMLTCNSKTMKTCDFGGGGGGLLLSSKSGECGFTNYYKESLTLLADEHHAAPDQKPTRQGRNSHCRKIR